MSTPVKAEAGGPPPSESKATPQPTLSEAYFFLNILKHMKGTYSIDWDAVAEESNFKNAGVARVRFGQIKKKLNFDGATSDAAKATPRKRAASSGGPGSIEKKPRKTPAKGKVKNEPAAPTPSPAAIDEAANEAIDEAANEASPLAYKSIYKPMDHATSGIDGNAYADSAPVEGGVSASTTVQAVAAPAASKDKGTASIDVKVKKEQNMGTEANDTGYASGTVNDEDSEDDEYLSEDEEKRAKVELAKKIARDKKSAAQKKKREQSKGLATGKQATEADKQQVQKQQALFSNATFAPIVGAQPGQAAVQAHQHTQATNAHHAHNVSGYVTTIAAHRDQHAHTGLGGAAGQFPCHDQHAKKGVNVEDDTMEDFVPDHPLRPSPSVYGSFAGLVDDELDSHFRDATAGQDNNGDYDDWSY